MPPDSRDRRTRDLRTGLVAPGFKALDAVHPRPVLTRKSLNDILEEMDPARFRQIQRCTMLNIRSVASVSHDPQGKLVVSLEGHPERLKVSRSFAQRFKSL